MARSSDARDRRLTAVYDGDCGLCRRLVAFWGARTGDAVDFVPAQQAGEALPQLDRAALGEALHTVAPDGTVRRGAAAVCEVLARVPGWQWTRGLYRLLPGARPVAEACYRLVARRRAGISKAVGFLAGRDLQPPSWCRSRRLFFGLFGLVFAFAFVSYWIQAGVLVGSDGLLPLSRTFADAREQGLSVFEFPSLLWLWHADAALDVLCGLGVALGLMLAGGLAPRPCLLSLYALYLSLWTTSGVFLAQPADGLLLEMAVLAWLLAPPGRWAPDWKAPPSALVRWLMLWLLFRILFGNGLAHLAGAWSGPGAVQQFLWTQPLPGPLALPAVHLPEAVHYGTGLLVLMVELPLALCLFGFRRQRLWAFLGIAGLLVATTLAGNRGFLEPLVMALALLALDDQTLAHVLPRRWRCDAGLHGARPWRWSSWATLAAVAVLFAASILQLAAPRGQPPGALRAAINRFSLANDYRALALVRPDRPELILQASDNRQSWHPYGMRHKPGRADLAPGFLFFHLPRVAWQAAFAARTVADGGEVPLWLAHLAVRLVQNNERARELFDELPFGDRAPRYVRVTLYDYLPASPAELAQGLYWQRHFVGPVTPPFSLGR